MTNIGTLLILLIKKDTSVIIGGIDGTTLYLPGGGNIYSSNTVNVTFDMRSKYIVSQDTITEIKQPFYYVGKQSITLENISIYLDTNKTHIVANLPKGSPVFIVGSEGDYCYLLKTPFGLLGWFHIKNQYGQTELEGIYNGE